MPGAPAVVIGREANEFILDEGTYVAYRTSVWAPSGRQAVENSPRCSGER